MQMKIKYSLISARNNCPELEGVDDKASVCLSICLDEAAQNVTWLLSQLEEQSTSGGRHYENLMLEIDLCCSR